MDNFALQQIINRIPLLKFRSLGSFPSDYVPTLDNDTFGIINTQPSNIQGEHWIMIANFQHEMYFADSVGYKRYSFLNNNQHYKQMLPAPLQSHPSVCGFFTIYGAFHLFTRSLHEVLLMLIHYRRLLPILIHASPILIHALQILIY